MNIVDIIIAAVVLIGFILGFKDGFVRKLIGLIGFAAALYLAIKFAVPLGAVMEDYFGIELYLAQVLAGIVIFFAVLLIFSIIKRLVHPFDKVNNLINQILGGAVGVIQILFFLSAVLYLLAVFDVPEEKTAESSLFYDDVYSIIPLTIDYINDYTPGTKKILREYIQDKDSIP